MIFENKDVVLTEADIEKNVASLREKLKGILADVTAPQGKVKLIMVDLDSAPYDAHSTVGIYGSVEEADSIVANLDELKGIKYYLYDDTGMCVKSW